jgi:solute carrier family 30 (zinc transporter), member 9
MSYRRKVIDRICSGSKATTTKQMACLMSTATGTSSYISRRPFPNTTINTFLMRKLGNNNRNNRNSDDVIMTRYSTLKNEFQQSEDEEEKAPEELKPSKRSQKYDARNDERSLKAVSTAITANTAILFCKLGGYAVSGSPSMLAESVHSVADIVNQALLRYGIVSSKRKPDATHNYGYHRERFVWSLISATGVFFLGSGVSISHGINALTMPEGAIAATENTEIALAILGASLALESYSAYVAYDALKLNALDRGMTVTQFIKSGRDPTSVSVLAEDAAAVAGCAVAAVAILSSKLTGIHAFDASGSIAIGGLLGVTAMYLINSNRLMLLGKSLGQDKMNLLNEKMRKDPVVSEIYLAKSEELGPGTFRYAAELEFDGTAIVNRFLEKDNNRERFREEFKRGVLENDDKVIDDALIGYGCRVITSVGDEVDRIEREIVELEPTIKYVDLETN